MIAALDALATFVPNLILARLQSEQKLPESGTCERWPAAALFADLAGFTKLANHLAQLGADGAGELCATLNEYYGQIIDRLHAEGGDVIGFAGDALVTVWPTTTADLPRVTHRAAQAAHRIQQSLTRYRLDDQIELSLRISVATGEVFAVHVGGELNFWQVIAGGSAIDALRATDARGKPTLVTLSPEAAKILEPVAKLEALPEGYARLKEIRRWREDPPLAKVVLPPELAPLLRSYVPQAILARFDAGMMAWVADLRIVTVLFLQLRLEAHREVEPVLLQQVMGLLQKSLRRFEGSLLQLMIDDKGVIGVAGFGLPPWNHEDDAARAVRASEDLIERFASAGLGVSIGISTGIVFSGPLGSEERRVYTVIGSLVNLAARMMQKAGTQEIWCDQATRTSTRGRIEFDALPLQSFKGIERPVPAFRPLRQGSQTPAVQLAARGALFGREVEQSLLRGFLDTVQSGQRRALFIEGPVGAGKSRLTAELVEQAQLEADPPRIAAGECSAIEQTTLYHPWQHVLQRLLAHESGDDRNLRQQQLAVRLAELPGMFELAPLLNPVLGVDFASNDLVAQLAGETLADNLHQLIIALLRVALTERTILDPTRTSSISIDQAEAEAAVQSIVRMRPAIILLDNVQWQDSASWKLAKQIATADLPIGIVFVTRALSDTMPDEWKEIAALATTDRLKLEPLSREAALALVTDRLQVKGIQDDLAALLYERSLGNPLFIEELANFLREADRLVIEGGVARLAIRPGETGGGGLPDSIRDLMQCRIDQLEQASQMTLKVASVVGREFEALTVDAVHPVDVYRGHTTEHLESLTHQEMVWPLDERSLARFVFKHILIQQVAYEELPLKQRREMHRRVASWLESTGAANPALHPLIAYHWTAASDLPKAIQYHALAGEAAMVSGAHREAAASFRTALSLHATLYGQTPSREEILRRAHWERQLGDACFKLSDHPASYEHLSRALKLWGQPLPQSKLAIACDAVWLLSVQFVRRIRERTLGDALFWSRSRARAAILAESSLCYERMSHIHYFRSEIVLGTHRTLRFLNAAEAGGKSPPLGRSYGIMSVVLALIRLPRLARVYASLAERVAHEVGHLPSLADVLVATSVFRMGLGQWDRADAGATECIAVAERLGNQVLLAQGVTIVAMVRCFEAKYAEALGHFERTLRIGEAIENLMYQAWGHCGRGECLLRLGEFAEAEAALRRAFELLHSKEDRTEQIRAYGLLAIGYLRTARPDLARQQALEGLQMVEGVAVPTASTLEGIAGMAECLLELYERDRANADLAAEAARGCQRMLLYAKIFPIGVPRACLVQGRQAWLQGKSAEALRTWKRGLAKAEELAIDWEIAGLSMALGVALGPTSDDGRRALERARGIYLTRTAPWELNAVEQLLGKPGKLDRL